jgi:putative CocE/NonD family hydrolase
MKLFFFQEEKIMIRSTIALRRPLRGALKIVFMFTILVYGYRGMPGAGQADVKVSRLGEYRGYSTAVYDGWVRSSEYVSMRDGVKIAIDIFRPTKNGKTAEEKLPVVWICKRYQRASLYDGLAVNLFAENGPHMTALLEHGYVLAAADTRGTGASFGISQGVYTQTEAQDAYEITEWLAVQAWSNGMIGMVGSSYEGTNQLMAAAKKPPHLKAIMPAMAMFDIYDLACPGGIFRFDLVKTWSELTRFIDTQKAPAPVDEDSEGKLLKEAFLLRPQNRSAYDIVAPLKYRDSKDSLTGQWIYETWQPAGFVREIREFGVAVYLICGWYDSYIRDAFLMFKNLGPRFKMVVLDCSHSPEDPAIVSEAINILTSEQLRWFDHWLKGIDNGVMQEAPIQYQTNIEAATRVWRSTDRWPLPEAKTISYFFRSGPSVSTVSTNDGRLQPAPPSHGKDGDIYTDDYSATSGQNTRWDNTVAGNFAYPDMAANDARGLTFTTEPLAEDLEVTGHPILHLWLASSAQDGDFIAYLEEVDAKGFSRYISEGCLRASHRSMSLPPYDNFGLPYHGSAARDIVPLTPGQPTELVFDLLPVSNVFNKGNRLRLTIVGADRDNLETPAIAPPPRVTVFRNRKAASRLDLPVVRRKDKN